MKTLQLAIFLAAFALALLPVACSSPEPPPDAPAAPPPATPESAAMTNEELLARWQELAKSAAKETMNSQEAVEIAAKLAQSDLAALNPILDVLADPGASPYAKVMAVASLTPIVNPGMTERLVALTKAESDATGRACATQLLTGIDGENIDAVLEGLSTDTERRVSFAAMRGLASRGSEKGRQALAALWDQPDTTAAERNEIVMALSARFSKAQIVVFEKAVVDSTLDELPRLVATTVLQQVGGQSAIEPLTACAEKDASEQVRASAKGAIKAIHDRLAEGADAPTS